MVTSKNSRKRKKHNEQRKNRFLAYEAVYFLLDRSLKNRFTNPTYSKDLYSAARKMGRRNRIHLPRHYSYLFCKSCFSPISIKTARIRFNSKKRQIHYQCLNCKHEHRFGYAKRKKRTEA